MKIKNNQAIAKSKQEQYHSHNLSLALGEYLNIVVSKGGVLKRPSFGEKKNIPAPWPVTATGKV
jgi:hypothetical protein